MAGSYRQINYTLRPAKAVERKMLGEAFRRLYPFERVSDYRYVGFGSIYFADFHLIHRSVGLNDMISIERNTNAVDCFEFNKPYKSIELKFGESNEVLPQVDWDKRTIIWLDYDGKLNSHVLSDVDTFCTRALSGSLMVISFNSETDREPAQDRREQIERETGEAFDLDEYRLDLLRSRLGQKVPAGTSGRQLRGKAANMALNRQVVLNQVAEALTIRNSALMQHKKLAFYQIFNFEYKDGAQMHTLGGVLVSQEQIHLFNACEFEELEFVRTGELRYEIKVPCLTAKEIRHLDAQLPTETFDTLDAPGIPEEDVQVYATMYRYFPSFSEIISN